MFITKLLENGRQHSTTKSQKRTSQSKKTNHTSNKPPSKLNNEHKAHLTDFFDENPSAIIQDAVQNLIKSFEDSQTKESRVAEFMKEGCNLSIKVITRHPAVRNKISTLNFVPSSWRNGCSEKVCCICKIVPFSMNQASI